MMHRSSFALSGRPTLCTMLRCLTRSSSGPTLRGVAACMLIVGLAMPVAAQREVASELFRAGRAAFDVGDFGASARAFEAAYAAEPSSATAYNAALAWERANEPARTVDALERALGGDVDVLDATLRAEAGAMLTRLRPTIGYLTVEGPTGTTLDVSFHRARVAPTRLPLRPGRHLVRWRTHDGRTEERVVEIGREEVRLDLSAMEPTTITPPTTSNTPPNRPPNTGPNTNTTPVDLATRTPSVTPGIAIVVTAGALAVGVAGLGVATLRARDEYVDGGRLEEGEYDRARSLRTATNIGIATAAVVGLIGLTLWIVRGRRSGSAHAATEVTPWSF